MPVKIIFSREKVETRIKYAFGAGMGMLANEILNDCNQYCKEDTGMLIASSYIHSQLDDGRLIWQTPYARRQYWEIRTAIPDPNPNATWKWCEAAKKARLPIWEKQAQRLLEMNL
jgi:hypothetical protein